MKRSPYFFMRQQAEKRLQTYMTTSLVLLFLTGIVAAYAWQAPADNISRVAVLENTKPPAESVKQLFQDETEVVDAAELVQTLVEQQTIDASASLSPSLPEEYDRYEPTAELNENTDLGDLTFSTEVTDRYEPVNPGGIFAEGSYTIYATFSYEAMSDGMEWAWVWRRDGEVIEGGNEIWTYGEDGPGYIYLNPEEGFENGEYSLDVWVNGELLTRSGLTVNSAAVSASD